MRSDKELREAGPPKTYDWTLLSNTCYRKLYWFLRGLDYATIPAYFVFGQAWQLALDSWYTPQVGIDWSPAEIKKHRDRAIEVARKHWMDSYSIGTSIAPAGAGSNTWENLEVLFKMYCKTYTVEPYRVLGAEKGWVWPLAGTPWMLGGSIDDYIEWEGLGSLVQENKTSGIYLSDQYIKQWDHSGQVSLYIWYLNQLKGKEVYGAYMNMACKRIPKKKVPDNLFARDLQTRTPERLDQFLEEQVVSKILDIEREWDRWLWPRTGFQVECVGGMGKSPCLYRPLCLLDVPISEQDPSAFQGFAWRTEEWAPWERG